MRHCHHTWEVQGVSPSRLSRLLTVSCHTCSAIEEVNQSHVPLRLSQHSCIFRTGMALEDAIHIFECGILGLRKDEPDP